VCFKFNEFCSALSSFEGDAVALLLRHRTCDLQVSSSRVGWAPLRSSLGQATYTGVPLSPSTIIWYYWPRGLISLAGKVTTDRRPLRKTVLKIFLSTFCNNSSFSSPVFEMLECVFFSCLSPTLFWHSPLLILVNLAMQQPTVHKYDN